MKDNKLREKWDKLKIGFKEKFKEQFLAEGTDPRQTRKKQIKLAFFIAVAVLVIVLLSYRGGSSLSSHAGTFSRNYKRSSNKQPKSTVIKDLTKGVTNEERWTENGQRSIDEMKQKQVDSEKKLDHVKEYLDKEKVSKEDLRNYLSSLEAKMKKEYEAKLVQELENIKNHPSGNTSSIDISDFRKKKKKKKFKKIGDYIPAGSYVQAKMISGVDAGVGVQAAVDPRQVLLRITDRATSAGYGKRYLNSKKLVGCILQCQAVGDISSEKVYLKPVLLTCARDAKTVVEVPVKGYVTAKGKSGIRGEVISREGDLVAKSFLSGLVGGFGGGLSQYAQGTTAIGGGFLLQDKGNVKDIFNKGLGSGLSSSTNRLSNYLIKRAEQYQPVISINEGIQVTVVFQEGFNLGEDE